MILAFKIIAVVVVLTLVVVAGLRIRKLRRDEMRELSKPLERRLVAPPPSPYTPSKGFRLLDGTGQPLSRPPVERPRLDPERHYVFSDAPANAEELAALRLRHNDDWFLSRSSHRSTLSIVSRRVAVVVLIILIIVVVATYYADHNSNLKSTVTTTTSTATTTTTPLPSSFVATSASGDDATYVIPAASYRVTVSGDLGPTWAVYDMGPSNTLEWQGTVAQGQVKLLIMTGDSKVTVGSPSNAAVKVDGRPVSFPSPLPSTLNLLFSSQRPPTAS